MLQLATKHTMNTIAIMFRMVLTRAILLKPQKTQKGSKQNQKYARLHADKIKDLSSCQNPIRTLVVSVGFVGQLLRRLHATSGGSAPEHCSDCVQQSAAVPAES